MKFKVSNVWRNDFEKEIEINTLDDLKNLSERLNKDNNLDSSFEPPYEIVINFEEMTITTY